MRGKRGVFAGTRDSQVITNTYNLFFFFSVFPTGFEPAGWAPRPSNCAAALAVWNHEVRERFSLVGGFA
jgi:hypothetical protein